MSIENTIESLTAAITSLTSVIEKLVNESGASTEEKSAPKKKRVSKKIQAADPEVVEQSEEPEVVPQAVEPEVAAEEITAEKLKTALMGHREINGKAATIGLLHKFGAKVFSDIPEAKYAELYNEATKAE